MRRRGGVGHGRDESRPYKIAARTVSSQVAFVPSTAGSLAPDAIVH
jgi:hypothetical protein